MLELQDISLLPTADCQGFPPLYRVSLRLAQDERFVALMGPKKSGASDLIQAIRGGSAPHTGTILWQGADASLFRSSAPNRISFCSAQQFPDEDDSLQSYLSSVFVEFEEISAEAAGLRIERIEEVWICQTCQHSFDQSKDSSNGPQNCPWCGEKLALLDGVQEMLVEWIELQDNQET